MTTELEQEFFKVFGIEKNNNNCPMLDKNNCILVPSECNYYQYPEITDRKLLQLLCICNDMQDCIDLCITPCKYEDAKEMILQTLINEKTSITDYEEDIYMDVMTKQIQQLFKEGE